MKTLRDPQNMLSSRVYCKFCFVWCLSKDVRVFVAAGSFTLPLSLLSLCGLRFAYGHVGRALFCWKKFPHCVYSILSGRCVGFSGHSLAVDGCLCIVLLESVALAARTAGEQTPCCLFACLCK